MSSREEKREDLLKHPEQFRDAVREMGRFFLRGLKADTPS